MQEENIAEQIHELLLPLAKSLNLELWGMEFSFGPRSVLRVYVENAEQANVDIEECAELSRLLGLSLDVADFIPGAYVLEVSSPGLERIYFTEEQLSKALGELVLVQLHRPLATHPNRKRFRGELISSSEGVFTLQLVDDDLNKTDQQVQFSFSQSKKVSRVHVFPDKAAAPKKAQKAKGKEIKKKNEMQEASQDILLAKNDLETSVIENNLEKQV